MKFYEQPGYSPDDFSSAQQYDERSPEEAAQLRAASIVVVDPFAEPVYGTQTKDEKSSFDDKQEITQLDSERLGEPEIPIEVVDWVILPVDEGEERGPNSGESGGIGAFSTAENPENRERLRSVARAWGNSSYIAVSNVEASDGTKYELAILPTTLGGLAIEHAIADTTVEDNTALAFRAEKGLSEDGTEVIVTWREVFKDGKKHAVKMGARRFYHTPTLNSRLDEYIALPASEIDRHS